MIEFDKNDNIVEIQYEATIATAQYENLKPKLIMKCKPVEVEQALLFLRSRLKAEYAKIKNIKPKEENGESKN
jgi:hypothetical protein